MVLPANGIKRIVALIAYGATTLSVLGSGVVFVDTRYAKADDVKAIRQDLQCFSRDTKLAHLKTRELFIVQEETRLEVQRQRTSLTPIEIQRYNELLAEHGNLQSERKRLDVLPGCP